MFSTDKFKYPPIVLILLLLFSQIVQAAVELISFTGTEQGISILIEWETATELDNAGFLVTRTTDLQQPFKDISGFISAQGSGVIGAQYQFVDDDVTIGNVYYYKLESIDNSQNVQTYGPIMVSFHVPTQTNTPSSTLTPSITLTPSTTGTPKTSTPTITRTPTKTRTPLPTKSATPITPTLTPTFFTATATASVTPSITPSPTLFDAPEIILIQPMVDTPITQLNSPTAQPTPTATPIGAIAKMIESGSLPILAIICPIILAWAVIAVGIFIFLQKRTI